MWDWLESKNLAANSANANTVRQHRDLTRIWESALDLDTERMPDTAGWAS
jgi:hypothetical protein